MKNDMKNYQLKSFLMLEIVLTFIGVGDVSFHYKLSFLRNCLRLNSVSDFSRLLRDLKFRCGFLIFNDES